MRGTIYIIYILGKLCFCRLFKNGVKVFDRSPRQATQGGPKQFGFVGESSQQQNHHHYKYLFWHFKYYCSEFASLYFSCFCQIYFQGSLPDTLTIHYAVQTKDRKRMKLKQVKQTLMWNLKKKLYENIFIRDDLKIKICPYNLKYIIYLYLYLRFLFVKKTRMLLEGEQSNLPFKRRNPREVISLTVKYPF